jgi:hypothetical protein
VKDVDFYATAEYRTSDNTDNCKDYLYATAKGKVTENGGIITLKFDHKASKLKFELTQGDGVTNDEFSSIASTDFSLTGLVKADQLSTTEGTISLSSDAASITDYSKSYIVAPQKQENKVQASITMNGIVYKTTQFDMNLAAGSSYTCKITVSKTGINITSHEVKIWNQVETKSYEESKTPIYNYGSIPYASSDVKQYALAFTDGSFENLLEGTATVPDTAKISKLNTLQLNNVCGIVYSTADPTSSDDVLAVDYPNCTHGLIVSLINVKSETYKNGTNSTVMHWSESKESIPYIQEGGKKDDPGKGYKFTKYLKSYNASQTESTSKVYPVDALVSEYTKTSPSAPSGSSDWFIPSASELYNFLIIYKNLESILLALAHKDVNVTTSFFDGDNNNDGSNHYWASSENSDAGKTYKAWGVTINDKANGTMKISSGEKIKESYHVRPVCAF